MTQDVTTTAPVATAPVVAPPAPVARCPWCSELLPPGTADQCPHCHANLVAGGDSRLPGLTEVEAPTAAKARRLDTPRRSKLLSWISGDIDDDQGPASGGDVAPDAFALPPRDVRREMLRLQLEAEGISVAADGTLELSSEMTADNGDAPATSPAADPVPEEATRKAS